MATTTRVSPAPNPGDEARLRTPHEGTGPDDFREAARGA